MRHRWGFALVATLLAAAPVPASATSPTPTAVGPEEGVAVSYPVPCLGSPPTCPRVILYYLDRIRRSGGLSLYVDGTLRVGLAVPPELSIVNPDPIRVGGNGLSPSNDQFHGRLDDVCVTVG